MNYPILSAQIKTFCSGKAQRNVKPTSNSATFVLQITQYQMKKLTTPFLLFFIFLCTGITIKARAQDAYIAEIRMFAGNYAPVNWLKCEGQLLAISQYTALFSLLGTTYGGNGITTFALPDLRGRIPMGTGQGPGLTSTTLGQNQGTETTTLLTGNMPSHSHTVNMYNGNGTQDTVNSASLPYPALVQNPDLSRSNAYTTTSPNAILNPGTLSSVGSNTPFSNKQPSLSLTFIICVNGLWPTHP